MLCQYVNGGFVHTDSLAGILRTGCSQVRDVLIQVEATKKREDSTICIMPINQILTKQQ